MPAALPPTPWIRGFDPAETYLGGARIGEAQAQRQAQLAMEAQRLQAAREEASARLAASQQQAMMEAQIRQQQLAQNHAIEQQKNQILNAYHQQQISMQQQKMQEQHAMNQFKIKQAADTYASTQAMQKDIAEGMDPYAAIMRHASGMRMTGPAYASVLKAMQDKGQTQYVPESAETGPAHFLQAGGQVTLVPDQDKRMREIELQGHMSEISKLQTMMATTPDMTTAAREQIDKLIQEHEKQIRILKGGTDRSGQRLEIGEDGVARWVTDQLGDMINQPITPIVPLSQQLMNTTTPGWTPNIGEEEIAPKPAAKSIIPMPFGM